jgi:ketosteroid isomerase-like protein
MENAYDMEKVRAASEAFYAALNARDPSAMAKVWAHTPYVTYISPVGSEIALGWDAVNRAWEEVLRKVTSKIDNYLRRAGVPQIVGDVAWEVGTETGPVTFADGKFVNFTAFATNIYRNIDGRWLMVSHQAGNQTETSSSQSPSWTLNQYPRRL